MVPKLKDFYISMLDLHVNFHSSVVTYIMVENYYNLNGDMSLWKKNLIRFIGYSTLTYVSNTIHVYDHIRRR